jgi:hypothetical protein
MQEAVVEEGEGREGGAAAELVVFSQNSVGGVDKKTIGHTSIT